MEETREDEDGSQTCSSSVCADTFQSSQSHHSDSDRSLSTCNPNPNPDSKDDHFEDEYPGLDVMIHEIQEVRETQRSLEKYLQALQTKYHRHNMMIHQALEEEKLRWDVLEQELTDLTELYQRETLDLKEEISSIKEMIDYQSHDRMMEFSVALEICQHHLLKLELQQKQHVDMKRPEETTTQTILRKVIKGLLVVASALLAVVCTVSHAVLFFKSPSHIISALLLVVLFLLIIKYWSIFPELHHVFPAF